jgi:hypothetical protein
MTATGNEEDSDEPRSGGVAGVAMQGGRTRAFLSLCALGLLCTVGCGGQETTTPPPTPTPRGINDLVFDATIASTCSDHSQDTFVFLSAFSYLGEPETSMRRVQDVTPDCYPRYQYKYEGLHTVAGRPLPWMGRTCGAFRLLAVFVDNETNRGLLRGNARIPQAIKDLVSTGQVQTALERLLASYTATDLFGQFGSGSLPIRFDFEVALSTGSLESFSRVASGSREWTGTGTRDTRVFEALGVGTRFASYDAVFLLDAMPQSGLGIKRWPKDHPAFHARDSSFLARIDPGALVPGLLSHELLTHNVPGLLSQYTLGPQTSETRGGVTYDVTPVLNPRTGENIEPLIRAYEGKTPAYVYFAGYADVDRDGTIDCIDPSIAVTADNVDGDMVPDRLDPDLNANNSAYFWKPQK